MSLEGAPSKKKPRGLRDALIAAGALVAAQTALPADSHAGPRTETRETQQSLSERDIALLAQNAYHEARGEGAVGQLAVTQVTLARLASGKFGKSVAEVIFSPYQYSWTHDPRILLSKMQEDTYENIAALTAVTVGGKSPAAAVQALSRITGLNPKTYYYKRSDWNEHDANEKRMSDKSKKMFQKLRAVGDIGRHRFYTD